LDSTDISISNKGKASIFTSGVEAYSKEALGDEIRRLITTNVQLITDKMETEKARVNLKADRVQLLGKKNSLVAKREKLRIEIVVLNTAGSSNVPIRKHQDPLLKLIRNKLKAKRSTPFDNVKENL